MDDIDAPPAVETERHDKVRLPGSGSTAVREMSYHTGESCLCSAADPSCFSSNDVEWSLGELDYLRVSASPPTGNTANYVIREAMIKETSWFRLPRRRGADKVRESRRSQQGPQSERFETAIRTSGAMTAGIRQGPLDRRPASSKRPSPRTCCRCATCGLETETWGGGNTPRPPLESSHVTARFHSFPPEGYVVIFLT